MWKGVLGVDCRIAPQRGVKGYGLKRPRGVQLVFGEQIEKGERIDV